MSGCPNFVKFQFENFDNYSFKDMPKGDLLRLGVNPYNGGVVLAYNAQNRGFEVADNLIEQIYRAKRELEGLCCSSGLEAFIRLKSGDEGIKEAYEKATARELERRLRIVLGGKGSDYRKKVG